MTNMRLRVGVQLLHKPVAILRNEIFCPATSLGIFQVAHMKFDTLWSIRRLSSLTSTEKTLYGHH